MLWPRDNFGKIMRACRLYLWPLRLFGFCGSSVRLLLIIS
uniref:Uncharacterized protein n=1 Tax=Picea sitchensis TaxID=3332 RepID=A9P1X8_PICSI|nr:unknown [Picea sitchensis]